MAIGKVALAALLLSAQSGGWQLQPATEGHGLTLVAPLEGGLSYRFECAPDAVLVTETGVTELMDLRSGAKIGDDAGAVMPEGAAVMALFTGKGDPKFQPAEAVKNPAGGWDLTIRLAKDDKQLRAFGKSEMISLFTTGYTAAVAMDASTRAKWNDFLKQCQATG